MSERMSESNNYGIYSETQYKENKDEIYWEDISGNIVKVTEVKSQKNGKSNFRDAVYLGKLKKYHSTNIRELN
jgi:hypothetical protein